MALVHERAVRCCADPDVFFERLDIQPLKYLKNAILPERFCHALNVKPPEFADVGFEFLTYFFQSVFLPEILRVSEIPLAHQTGGVVRRRHLAANVAVLCRQINLELHRVRMKLHL